MSGAALAIGAGMQAYGSFSQGIQKRDAYQSQAAQKRATAAEVQIGADREIQLATQAAGRTRAAQITSFGKSGVSVSSGSPLAVLEQSASNAFDQVNSIQQQADYRKSTLEVDAQQSGILGDQAYDAGVLGMFGAGVGAFSKNPYSYDQPENKQSGSILTGDSKMSNTGVDAADYDSANYARLHYMRGNL